MNKKLYLLTIVSMVSLFLIQVIQVSAESPGNVFAGIEYLFGGLFQGALPLILLLFVILLVLGLFTAPVWLTKIFGWTK